MKSAEAMEEWQTLKKKVKAWEADHPLLIWPEPVSITDPGPV